MLYSEDEIKFPIPEKAKSRLLNDSRGFTLNVMEYELYGITEVFGTVGPIQEQFTQAGPLKLKRGDRWVEELDVKNWSIRFKKLS